MAVDDLQNAYYGFEEGYNRLQSTVTRVYDIADYEPCIRILKFKMADPIWRSMTPKMLIMTLKKGTTDFKVRLRGFMISLITIRACIKLL